MSSTSEQIRNDLQDYIDQHPLIGVDALVKKVDYDQPHHQVIVELEYMSDYGFGAIKVPFPVVERKGPLPHGTIITFNTDLLRRRVSSAYKEDYKGLRRKVRAERRAT